MKLAMTSVLALSMMVASAFGAAKQDAPKTTTTPDTKVTTPKVKKHKKAVKSTSAAVTPVVKPVVASK
jgi:hypothetical protein